MLDDAGRVEAVGQVAGSGAEDRLRRHGSCPGSMRLRAMEVNGSWPPDASPSIGSSRNPTWSPRSRRSSTPPGEPVVEPRQDRRAAGPGRQSHARELVDLVAGLPAEQLGEVVVGLRDEVDDEHLGLRRHAEGAVAPRQPDEEPRRMDRRLRREPDEAAPSARRRPPRSR